MERPGNPDHPKAGGTLDFSFGKSKFAAAASVTGKPGSLRLDKKKKADEPEKEDAHEPVAKKRKGKTLPQAEECEDEQVPEEIPDEKTEKKKPKKQKTPEADHTTSNTAETIFLAFLPALFVAADGASSLRLWPEASWASSPCSSFSSFFRRGG